MWSCSVHRWILAWYSVDKMCLPGSMFYKITITAPGGYTYEFSFHVSFEKLEVLPTVSLNCHKATSWLELSPGCHLQSRCVTGAHQVCLPQSYHHMWVFVVPARGENSVSSPCIVLTVGFCALTLWNPAALVSQLQVLMLICLVKMVGLQLLLGEWAGTSQSGHVWTVPSVIWTHIILPLTSFFIF